MWTRETFRRLLPRPVIGMVHLPPLPGAPKWAGSMTDVIEFAKRDAGALAVGGVGAIMIENYHDVPFCPGPVPAATVAAMTAVISEVGRSVPQLPLGVNVLRNDGAAALSIAAAVGARFVRVNVLSGAVVTDQRVIEGEAHRLLRLRRDLGADVGILADLRVKHGRPLVERPLAEEAADLRLRALADALIVTGEATGARASAGQLQELRRAQPDCPLLVGSGLTFDNVGEFAADADGFIVGTSLKISGADGRPVVDADRCNTFCAAAAAGLEAQAGKEER